MRMIPGGPMKKGWNKDCMVVSVGHGMIESFFPATAMPDLDWWEALWPRPGEVLAELGLQPHMEIVDLCCGDGLFTAPLARMVHHIVAIDLDRRMLDLARAKVAAAGAQNCEFIEGDAYDVAALVSRPVDFVLMANTFHGVPEKERLARAVAAILRPGGRFAVVNWHRRPREETTVLGQPRGPSTEMRMEPEDVAGVVEPAGLTCARVVELPPYHYAAIFETRWRSRRAAKRTMENNHDETGTPNGSGGTSPSRGRHESERANWRGSPAMLRRR